MRSSPSGGTKDSTDTFPVLPIKSNITTSTAAPADYTPTVKVANSHSHIKLDHPTWWPNGPKAHATGSLSLVLNETFDPVITSPASARLQVGRPIRFFNSSSVRPAQGTAPLVVFRPISFTSGTPIAVATPAAVYSNFTPYRFSNATTADTTSWTPTPSLASSANGKFNGSSSDFETTVKLSVQELESWLARLTASQKESGSEIYSLEAEKAQLAGQIELIKEKLRDQDTLWDHVDQLQKQTHGDKYADRIAALEAESKRLKNLNSNATRHDSHVLQESVQTEYEARIEALEAESKRLKHVQENITWDEFHDLQELVRDEYEERIEALEAELKAKSEAAEPVQDDVEAGQDEAAESAEESEPWNSLPWEGPPEEVVGEHQEDEHAEEAYAGEEDVEAEQPEVEQPEVEQLEVEKPETVAEQSDLDFNPEWSDDWLKV